MFLVYVLIGYGTLVLLGQDLSLLTPNVAMADADDAILYDVHKELKTWDDAKDFCENQGMTLAYVITLQQHLDLIQYIEDHNLLPRDTLSGYWLGGKYKTDGWLWDVTSINTDSDDYFMAGWHRSGSKRWEKNGVWQDCMELKYIQKSQRDKSLGWNAMWCDEKRGFICQYQGQKIKA